MKQMIAVPGIAMLEQALAVHLGGKYSSDVVTDITKFSKNPNRLMHNLLGGNIISRIRMMNILTNCSMT